MVLFCIDNSKEKIFDLCHFWKDFFADITKPFITFYFSTTWPHADINAHFQSISNGPTHFLIEYYRLYMSNGLQMHLN